MVVVVVVVVEDDGFDILSLYNHHHHHHNNRLFLAPLVFSSRHLFRTVTNKPINCLPKRIDYFFAENLYLFNEIVYRPEVNTFYTHFKKGLYLFNTFIYRSKEK